MINTYFLVDDDQDDIELFEEALNNIDDSIEFHAAQNGAKLFEILSASNISPQIIFLDINMPGMTGWECLAELKRNENWKKIPVVMYSTSSSRVDGEKAISSGAIGFLEKPASFMILKEFLEKIAFTSDQNLIPTLKNIVNTRLVKLMVG